MHIRAADTNDTNAIWQVIRPAIRAGETLAINRDIRKEDALSSYWLRDDNRVFVAEQDGQIIGSYFLRANQGGGGSHVGNAAYITDARATGKGVARYMCEHSLETARATGFRALQFNFVVSTNERAVRLWQSCGFEITGRLHRAFLHPAHGYVDALVMFRSL